MARAAYTDCTLPFTCDANSNPNATVAAAVVVTLYKKAYDYVYGPDTYSTDESTDSSGFIDSDEFRVLIVAETEQILVAMYTWDRDKPWPAQEWSREGKKELDLMMRRKAKKFGNVRLWNESYWDADPALL